MPMCRIIPFPWPPARGFVQAGAVTGLGAEGRVVELVDVHIVGAQIVQEVCRSFQNSSAFWAAVLVAM